MTLAYAADWMPDDYVCSGCKAKGCKLWRHTDYVGPIPLFCATCVERETRRSFPTLDATGRHQSKYGWTDQLGPFLPAVPDEEEIGYYGYTSVPDEAVAWWRALPTRPGAHP